MIYDINITGKLTAQQYDIEGGLTFLKAGGISIIIVTQYLLNVKTIKPEGLFHFIR